MGLRRRLANENALALTPAVSQGERERPERALLTNLRDRVAA